MTALLRRPEAALFVLVLGAYAYFYQAGGWNQNARFDLVRAIVERGTLRIDAYESNTGDKAERDGHLYSDKAPGVSFTALPVYAAAHALGRHARETDRFQALASYLCTVWAVALPSALAVVALYLFLIDVLRLAPHTSAAFAIAYAFGTLAFPYSTLLYGHQPAVAFAFLGFAILARARQRHRSEAPVEPRRLVAAGLALGWAVVIEYPAALTVAAVAVYALATIRPWRRLAWLALAMAAGLAVLFAYHALAFGGPFDLPYSFSVQQPRHRGLFMGLVPPTLRVLRYLLVDEYRGLFYGSPWLLLAVPGAWFLLRDRRVRPEALVCVAVALLYLALNASLTDWHGGWGMGPRHLVAVLPFLAVLAAGVTAGLGRRALAIAGGGAALVSIFLMLAGTSVKPEVPRVEERPFTAFLLPAFLEGRLALNTQSIDMVTGRGHTLRRAWNLGERLGLEGLATLVPLAVFVLGALAWLLVALRTQGRAASAG
jgi:hypothetical protein